MANSDIPTTAREFERWMNEAGENWSQELRNAGQLALLTLKSLDQPSAHQSAASWLRAAKT